MKVFIKLKNKPTQCPVCQSSKRSIKDYRNRQINHALFTSMQCILIYRIRRYQCQTCFKNYDEDNPFIPPNKRLSTLTIIQILKDLKRVNETYTSIANRYYTTNTNVINIFDRHVQIHRARLSRVVCIDEFYLGRHGVAGKYACVLYDFTQNIIIDILPTRQKVYLRNYFQKFSAHELNSVRFVCIDMWTPYRDVAQYVFKNAIICVDSFHVIQNISRALNTLRISVMNRYDKGSMEYYLLKKFNFLLMKNKDNVAYNTPRFNRKLNRYINYYQLLELILSIDENLSLAYQLKELYLRFNKKATLENASERFDSVLEAFTIANISQYDEVLKMLKNWRNEIINSFHYVDGYRISNSRLESRISRIKILLKNANGMFNFDRLRNRVMYCLNDNSAPALNDEFPSLRYKYK